MKKRFSNGQCYVCNCLCFPHNTEDYEQLVEDIVRDGRLYASENHQEILKVSHHCGPAGVDASYCTRVNVNCVKSGKSHYNLKDKRVEYIGINKPFFLLPPQSI